MFSSVDSDCISSQYLPKIPAQIKHWQVFCQFNVRTFVRFALTNKIINVFFKRYGKTFVAKQIYMPYASMIFGIILQAWPFHRDKACRNCLAIVGRKQLSGMPFWH